MIQTRSSDIIKKFIQKESVAGYENGGKINLDNEVNLIEQGIIDSYGLVRLLIFIEETFNVDISGTDMDFDDFQTINSICSLIESKKNM